MKTKLFPTFTSLVLAGAVSCLLLAGTALAQEKVDPKLQAKAKLTKEEAQVIALKQVPNATVKDAELEEEDGILRWSFDLKTHGSKNITEVGVDAVTGKVVENKVENAKDEAKETKTEHEAK